MTKKPDVITFQITNSAERNSNHTITRNRRIQMTRKVGKNRSELKCDLLVVQFWKAHFTSLCSFWFTTYSLMNLQRYFLFHMSQNIGAAKAIGVALVGDIVDVGKDRQ